MQAQGNISSSVADTEYVASRVGAARRLFSLSMPEAGARAPRAREPDRLVRLSTLP